MCSLKVKTSFISSTPRVTRKRLVLNHSSNPSSTLSSGESHDASCVVLLIVGMFKDFLKKTSIVDSLTSRVEMYIGPSWFLNISRGVEVEDSLDDKHILRHFLLFLGLCKTILNLYEDNSKITSWGKRQLCGAGKKQSGDAGLHTD